MIDVVPRYLSCGIKLLTKHTESLIANIHKIPICAPAIHHPSAITAAGPPPPAEGSCASRREKQLHKPRMLQTDISWCFLWFKDVGQSHGWFTK